MTPPTTSEETPHITAIERSMNAGFQFVNLRDPEDGAVEAIYAERSTPQGTVETYTLRGMTEAIAARFRAEEFPQGDPLWQTTGTVAEVITALLELPPHDAPDAPNLARHAFSSLWVPDSGCKR